MSKLLVRKKTERPIKKVQDKPTINNNEKLSIKSDEKKVRKNDERLVRFKIVSHTGDKVHIKLPKEFVKMMVKNNTIDFFNNKDDIVDSQKLLNLLIEAMDYDLIGEVAHLERSNGDIIRVIID